MKFKNQMNGVVEELPPLAWLWTLLFGIIYFAARGIWTHFIVGLLVGILTGGLSWLIYPFFAKKIIREHYLSNGWVEVVET